MSGLPSNGRVVQPLSASAASGGATIQVVNPAGAPVPMATVLNTSLRIKVTDASGAVRYYNIQPTGTALTVENINNAASTTQATITNRILLVQGNLTFHITASSNPLVGTYIDMQGDNVWLYFEGIRPTKFESRLLRQIIINGQRAQANTTVRLVQYLQGCVLISQPSTFQPLTGYSATSYGGSSMRFGLYTYYKAAQLGTFNDNIRSFKLRKAYMATFAQNELGTGFSKTFIATDADLEIPTMPTALSGATSFIRVFPWRWAATVVHCSRPTRCTRSGVTTGATARYRAAMWSTYWGRISPPPTPSRTRPTCWASTSRTTARRLT